MKYNETLAAIILLIIIILFGVLASKKDNVIEERSYTDHPTEGQNYY